jgi:molybdopterin-guanine dinucleotide biosynthesis protein A
MSTPPLLQGLVLAGGASSRMRSDKAALLYDGSSQLDRAVELLRRHVSPVFVSVRAIQSEQPERARYPLIVDSTSARGPIAGIRSALAAHRDVAWLVVACDLPYLTDEVLASLIAERDPAARATAFRSAHDDLPEPLCAIWEPQSAADIDAFLGTGRDCPRKFLIRHAVRLLELDDRRALDNVNTPEDYERARDLLGRPRSALAPIMQLNIQYFALMREQSGRSEETLETVAATPADLYAELQARYGFTLPREQLKVAVNTEFAPWSRPLAPGDAVVFIPPVAGG